MRLAPRFTRLGWPVIICFDCGNLLSIGRSGCGYTSSWGEVHLRGDDDHQKTENAGRTVATVSPSKWQGSPSSGSTIRTAKQTNDLHIEQGLSDLGATQEVLPVDLPAAQGSPENDPLHGKLNWGDRGLRLTHDNLMLILQEHKD